MIKLYTHFLVVFVVLGYAASTTFSQTFQSLDDASRNLQEAFNKAALVEFKKAEKKNMDLVVQYTKTIEMSPSDFQALANRAETYQKLQRYTEAIADYTKIIESNGEDLNAYNRRALFYSSQQKYTEAIADYTKVIELNPKDANAYYSRGLAYKALGKTKQAYADGAKAKSLGYKLKQ